ncbi:hypothetical protein AAMO2058_000536800 [Amorphochlora amoebiformis]
MPRTKESRVAQAKALRGGLSSVVSNHITNISSDLQTSGLPFEDSKSRWAGLSGYMYALPALATPFLWEKGVWILQALLSVTADYYYVNDIHMVHGVDRIFATYNTIRMILIVAACMPMWTVVFALIPLSFYYHGALAKKNIDVQSWIFYHTLWHISGGLLCAIFTYLVRYVYHMGDPAYETI